MWPRAEESAAICATGAAAGGGVKLPGGSRKATVSALRRSVGKAFSDDDVKADAAARGAMTEVRAGKSAAFGFCWRDEAGEQARQVHAARCSLVSVLADKPVRSKPVHRPKKCFLHAEQAKRALSDGLPACASNTLPQLPQGQSLSGGRNQTYAVAGGGCFTDRTAHGASHERHCSRSERTAIDQWPVGSPASNSSAASGQETRGGKEEPTAMRVLSGASSSSLKWDSNVRSAVSALCGIPTRSQTVATSNAPSLQHQPASAKRFASDFSNFKARATLWSAIAATPAQQQLTGNTKRWP